MVVETLRPRSRSAGQPDQRAPFRDVLAATRSRRTVATPTSRIAARDNRPDPARRLAACALLQLLLFSQIPLDVHAHARARARERALTSLILTHYFLLARAPSPSPPRLRMSMRVITRHHRYYYDGSSIARVICSKQTRTRRVRDTLIREARAFRFCSRERVARH